MHSLFEIKVYQLSNLIEREIANAVKVDAPMIKIDYFYKNNKSITDEVILKLEEAGYKYEQKDNDLYIKTTIE